MSHRHALVLSGGGAYGAYGVGVIKALLGGQSPATGGEPLDPVIFTGTSIGSFNASFLVSQWADHGAGAVDNLATVWLKRLAEEGSENGGFRIRLNPLDMLDPRTYLKNPLKPLLKAGGDAAFLTRTGLDRATNLLTSNQPMQERLLDLFDIAPFVEVEPWEETLEETIDYAKIRESDKLLRIAATNWVDGEVKIFGNSDMTDELGPRIIRASSAVPGFYPPTSLRGKSYVDGAVLMNTPLKPALNAEVDVLHVIYVNADVANMPIDKIQTTLEMLYRSQIIAWTAAVDRDIERAGFYNQGLELLERGASAEDLTDEDLNAFVRFAGPIASRGSKASKYRRVTIHRHCPPLSLGGVLDFLKVKRDHLERLMQEGYENTVNHDCEANGCVLAEAAGSAA